MTSRYPQYFIRIFPYILKEDKNDGTVPIQHEINPSNVISIKTDKSIYSASGTWSIELDYKYGDLYKHGDLKQDSWFSKIYPMDYVEIYMRDDVLRKKDGSIIRTEDDSTSIPAPIGIYGMKTIKENLKDHSNDNLKWLGNFNQTILKIGNKIIAVENPSFYSGMINSGEAEIIYERNSPLPIQYKAINPDLVLCGFVDKIRNNFQVSESGTNNRLIINGRCVAKFLQVHQIWFNILNPRMVTLQQTLAKCVAFQKAADVIESILFVGLEVFLNNYNATQVNAEDVKEGARYLETITGELVMFEKQSLKQGKVVSVIRDILNTFARYIYYSIAERSTSKYWSRLEDRSSNRLRAVAPFNEGNIWSILQKQVAPEQNELWVDEAGNLVFRKMIDAWTQPENYVKENVGRLAWDGLSLAQGSVITQSLSGAQVTQGDKVRLTDLRTDVSRPNDRPWAYISGEDIISWNLERSDDSLKTLITVHSVTNLLYGSGTLSSMAGQAPLCKEVRDFIVNSLNATTTEQAQINDFQNRTIKNIEGIDILTEQGINDFWKRYGLRVLTAVDQYSDTLPDFINAAFTLLEKYANFWWNGTITVRGSAQYRLGTMLRVHLGQDEESDNYKDLIFYIYGVSHNFAWGEGWTTTLKVCRGSKVGTLSDHRVEIDISTSSRDKTLGEIGEN